MKPYNETGSDWNDQTLSYYRENADSFLEGTLSADMSDARSRFLQKLEPQAYILDLGCGSGRDTKAFLEQGYRVDAADGSEELCRRASEYTGIPVRHMLFQELDAQDIYDGVWSCASLLHLPKAELAPVLRKVANALKINGVLYASFKYGNYEGMRGGRFFSDFTEESLTEFWERVWREEYSHILKIREVWLTADVRPGREEERWISLLAERD